MTRYIDANALKETFIAEFWKAMAADDVEYDAIKAMTKVIDNAPTAEAIPIGFIQERIAELKAANAIEFRANGGFTSPTSYEIWELERIIRRWIKEQHETD